MNKINTISPNCLKLIEHFECSGNVNDPRWLNAAPDTGGVWTIGIGTTVYFGHEKVKKGDKCTPEQAYAYLRYDLLHSAAEVDELTDDNVLQQQFDALVSFDYNKGCENYRTSHLRQVINNNPSDYQAIVTQWLRWKFDNGMVEPGLLRRAKAEAYLYCHGILKFFFTNNDTIILI